MGNGNGQMVGGRYHYIVVRSFDFILGTTAAFWKDIRFTSERHLRYIAGDIKGCLLAATVRFVPFKGLQFPRTY